MGRKKKESTVDKKMDLFGFINAIYMDQTSQFFDNLSDGDKKQYRYSRYMIHRFLSMNPHYLPLVNELQKYSQIPDRSHYLFLANIVPRGRQFYKYIKGSKEEKYESWLVELIAKHYNVSKNEAIQYIEILNKKDKKELKVICEMYGIDMKKKN